MFVPITNHTVSVIIERSSASITSSGSGVDQTTVQSALTAQGYTSQRSTKLDQLDVAISSRAIPGAGLSTTQATALDEIHSAVNQMTGSIDYIYQAKFGRWKLEDNCLIFYRTDNVTEIARYQLYNQAGQPCMTRVYDRRKV